MDVNYKYKYEVRICTFPKNIFLIHFIYFIIPGFDDNAGSDN